MGTDSDRATRTADVVLEEADHFFGATEARAIQARLANRSSVLVAGMAATIQCCLAGHHGLESLNSQGQGIPCGQNVLAAVLDGSKGAWAMEQRTN